MVDKIRVFIGAAANNEDLESQAVLEYTIRKHCSKPVQIIWMQQTQDKSSFWHGFDSSRWPTPFSGFRWAIPEYCNFEGKAIYMDSDMIVNADLAELISQDHNGAPLLAKGGGQWRICVSVWDCEAARDYLPPVKEQKKNPNAHKQINSAIKNHIRPFAGDWNCLDRELGNREPDDPRVKILHYTDMRSQPQLRHAIPRLRERGQSHWYDGSTTPKRFPKINAYFDKLLKEANWKGYKTENYVRPVFGPYKKKSYAGR